MCLLFHLRSTWYIRMIEVNKAGHNALTEKKEEKNARETEWAAYKNAYVRHRHRLFVVCMHQMTRYILHRVCHRIMPRLPLHTHMKVSNTQSLARMHTLDTLLLPPACIVFIVARAPLNFLYTFLRQAIWIEDKGWNAALWLWCSCVNWICRCGTGGKQATLLRVATK